jgi:hypothetical protein
LTKGLPRQPRSIDKLLEQRYRDLEYQMFADGCTDFDGMEEVVLQQREADAVWRVATLAQVRTWLHDECADARGGYGDREPNTSSRSAATRRKLARD